MVGHMALIADAVMVERGGRRVAESPSFTIAPGQAATITGPNGAGKSTLLRALAGLLPLAGGTVRLNDIDLADDPPAFRDQIAYAGHLDAVKPALSVRANLAGWSAILGDGDPVRVDAALDRFSLTHISDAPAGWCSAGQKRRLGLARLLVTDRALWLLDEPTVSLDAGSVAIFAQEVARHCAGGGMAVAATHIDIGLPDGPSIHLTPPTAAAVESADPFLSGDW